MLWLPFWARWARIPKCLGHLRSVDAEMEIVDGFITDCHYLCFVSDPVHRPDTRSQTRLLLPPSFWWSYFTSCLSVHQKPSSSGSTFSGGQLTWGLLFARKPIILSKHTCVIPMSLRLVIEGTLLAPHFSKPAQCRPPREDWTGYWCWGWAAPTLSSPSVLWRRFLPRHVTAHWRWLSTAGAWSWGLIVGHPCSTRKDRFFFGSVCSLRDMVLYRGLLLLLRIFSVNSDFCSPWFLPALRPVRERCGLSPCRSEPHTGSGIHSQIWTCLVTSAGWVRRAESPSSLWPG